MDFQKGPGSKRLQNFSAARGGIVCFPEIEISISSYRSMHIFRSCTGVGVQPGVHISAIPDYPFFVKVQIFIKHRILKRARSIFPFSRELTRHF